MSIGVTDIPVRWDSDSDDLLNVKDYLDGLQDFILQCPTPISIAIQGDWGTGKTSIMNYLRIKLEQNPAVRPVYFNTWQYSQFDMSESLYFSFFSAIASAIGGTTAKEFGKKLLSASMIVGKNLFSSVTGIDRDKLEEVASVLADNRSKAVEQIAAFHSEFAETVRHALAAKKQERLVIFIDDLDRLAPAVAVELLEVMKLFMDVEQCVFVLAVDYDVVVQGVRQKYGGNMPLSKCRSFFDKIVQLSFRMPVESYDLKHMLEKYLQDHIKPVYYPVLTDFIRVTVGKNPRSFKRLLNSYLLLLSVYKNKSFMSDDADASRAALFCCLCIQSSSEEAYTALLTDEFWEEDTSPLRPDGSMDEELLNSLLKKLFPRAEQLESDTVAKVHAILEELPSAAERICGEGKAGMDRFKELLFASSITATGTAASAAIGKRGTSAKITRIVLAGESFPVRNATAALTETYRYFTARSGRPAEDFLQLSNICRPGERSDGYFRAYKLLNVGGTDLWLGTNSGTPVKWDHVKMLCRFLSLPAGSVVWYEGDTEIYRS